MLHEYEHCSFCPWKYILKELYSKHARPAATAAAAVAAAAAAPILNRPGQLAWSHKLAVTYVQYVQYCFHDIARDRITPPVPHTPPCLTMCR